MSLVSGGGEGRNDTIGIIDGEENSGTIGSGSDVIGEEM